MGGGGDGGYGDRQAAEDARKQRARNALNVNFGMAPAPGSSVRREDFYSVAPVVGSSAPDGSSQNVFDREASGTLVTNFDQAGYDKALADEAALAGQAGVNKTALDQLYSGVRDNAFSVGKTRLDDQNKTAGRDLKFELFSRGLNGGSVDVDQNALRGRTYTQGLADLSGKADATATQLRTNDETTRVGLLQSIDNGMDQGSAISSALNQLKNNSDRAASEAQGVNLGDLFAGTGMLYEQGRRARGEQTAADTYRMQTGGYGGYKPPRGAVRGISSNSYDGG